MTEFLFGTQLMAWVFVWALGGVWLTVGAFRLQRREQVVVGVAVGFLLQNWLTNWLARVIPLPLVSWVAAVVVLAAGFGLALWAGSWRGLRFAVRPLQLVLFAGLVGVYFMIARGMAIFDDYAHLPTVSLMATGDIPPHFSLDPTVIYGYHHFMMLFSAQVMRLADLPPWTALDVARGLTFGISVLLAALWAQRLTRSRLAGLLGGLFMAFGTGARWLLLFLPHKILVLLGKNIQLLGSGVESGPTLADALASPWAAEGSGRIPFPFAFANGIYPAGVINGHSINGLISFTLILLLLLTFNRWRSAAGGVLSAIILSVWGLVAEVELVVILAGWGAIVLLYAIRGRSLRLPADLWKWVGVIGAGTLLGLLAGGAWTDLLVKWFTRLTTGQSPASYQTVGFTLAPPAIVSAHLGVLSLFDPLQILVALLEIGPVLLVLPLLVRFGWRAFRLGRWYEAATAASALVSLALLCTQFTGSTGVRNTSRLYVFIPLCAVFAVPLAWWWAARKSETIKTLVVTAGLVAVTGGVVMFGIELMTTQHPVYSYYLTILDDRMYQAHWNRLEPGALVFDPEPSRGPTLFGRFTDAAYTWYANKPGWLKLYTSPDPAALQAAGFDYVYLDHRYWAEISPVFRQKLEGPCVKVLDENSDEWGNFRRLLDIRDCR